MSQLALLLVLISAVTHSVWNLQVKRAGDKFVFVWLLVVVGWALAFPVWVTKWPELQAMPRGVWLLALASGACYAGYFTLLGRSYQSGAVSVAYPITRGVGPLGVMLLAVLLLGEPVSVAGIAGGLWTLKVYWRRLKGFFTPSRPSEGDGDEAPQKKD